MPIVLITGASSGIGAALAREYAKRNARLVLLARRRDRLDELARPNDLALDCDVTKDGDLERAVAAALERFGCIDVAIANAGMGVMGSVEKLSLEDYRRQFETNVFGVLRTVKAVLDPIKRSHGRLAVVGSVNGYVALPGTSAYAMSKFAARALCESLMGELAPHGVSVTHVAPGFVESEIRVSKDGRDPIPRALLLPARIAAKQIADAIEARRSEVVLTNHGKAGVFLQRHTPAFMRGAMRLLGRRVTSTLDRMS